MRRLLVATQVMATTHAVVPRRLSTLVLAMALAVAGFIHCLLTPEHMAMSAILGIGFFAAGIAQMSLAALAVVRPSRLLYAAVIASTVVLSSTYAYNVLVGLPFHEKVATAMAVHEAASGHEPHSESDGHDDTASHAKTGHGDEAAGTTDHHEESVAVGAGEPVDAYGAVTQLAQLSAAAVAFTLLRRTGRGSA
ncbi:MAG TPA: hypothetical protein VGW38_26505 [Chloroflexota bacterium]|nr:hypothetical protein [Chloroflexota bacterium]